MIHPANLCKTCGNVFLNEIVVGHAFKTEWACPYHKPVFPKAEQCATYDPIGNEPDEQSDD